MNWCLFIKLISWSVKFVIFVMWYLFLFGKFVKGGDIFIYFFDNFVIGNEVKDRICVL